MLQKKYRLRKHSAIMATYKINNFIADKNICIYFGKQKKDENIPVKIAFIVSKKVHKRAVVRNYLKRIMRENFRQILKNSEYDYINNHLSILCIAKKQAVNSNFHDIKASIFSLLDKKRNDIL